MDNPCLIEIYIRARASALLKSSRVFEKKTETSAIYDFEAAIKRVTVPRGTQRSEMMGSIFIKFRFYSERAQYRTAEYNICQNSREMSTASSTV